MKKLTKKEEKLLTEFIRVGGKLMTKYAKKDGWFAYAKLLEHFNNKRLRVEVAS